MKRQTNTRQVKEHDKCPPNLTKEDEIGSLPEKEYRIMIVKMIKNLKNKIKNLNSLGENAPLNQKELAIKKECDSQ